MGETEKALANYQKALKLDPENGMVYFNRGVDHYNERKYNEDGNPRYEIVEKEAEVIRSIFNHRKQGWSLGKIARYLNENDISTKSGKRWTRRGVLNILKHFVYTGNTTRTDGSTIPSLLYPEIIPIRQFNRICKSPQMPTMAY